MDFDAVLGIARDLPGVEVGVCYGTPGLRVKKKRFARHLPDDDASVVRATHEQRDALMAEDSKVFYVTDHYLNHPWVSVRLGTVSFSALEDVLTQAWRQRAPKRLLEEFDLR